jgi:hypothetical protein
MEIDYIINQKNKTCLSELILNNNEIYYYINNDTLELNEKIDKIKKILKAKIEMINLMKDKMEIIILLNKIGLSIDNDLNDLDSILKYNEILKCFNSFHVNINQIKNSPSINKNNIKTRKRKKKYIIDDIDLTCNEKNWWF